MEPLSQNPNKKIWNAMFISAFIVNVAMSLGQFMMNTLISKFANHLGAASSVVGLIASLFTVTALIVKPVSGPIVDVYSKKKILCAAILVIMVAFIGYGISTNVQMVMISRLIHGLGMGFTASTCLAIASDALPEGKLTQGIGYFSLGQALVSAAGPPIGLWLVDMFGYRVAFFCGAAVMAAAAVLAATMKTPPMPEERRKLKISLNNTFAMEAILPAVLLFLLAMSYGSINSFLVLYAEADRGIGNIGIFFTVYALCMLVTRPAITKLADKIGMEKVLIPAFMMFGVSMFLISNAKTMPMFLVAAVINACGYGAAQPTVQAFCMKCVSPERRGVGSSTSYIGMDIGYLIGPILCGSIAGNFGYPAMYQIMIAPIVLGIIVIFLNRKKIAHIDRGA